MKILAVDAADGATSMTLKMGGVSETRWSAGGKDSLSWMSQTAHDLLAEAELSFAQLDRLACSRGPGGFTSVRVAMGYMQGLSFALGLPVAAISSLQALASAAPQEPGHDLICSALDARMGEMYFACYQRKAQSLHLVGEERVLNPEDFVAPTQSYCAVGSGFAKYTQLAAEQFRADVRLSAHAVADLAEEMPTSELSSAMNLQPVYLRNRVALTKAQRAAGEVL